MPAKDRESELLGSVRRARVHLQQEAREATAISSLDDFSINREEERVGYGEAAAVAHGTTKLQKARAAGEQLQKELGTLCSGLEEKLNEIGYSVSEAYTFQGWEKLYLLVGKFGFKSATNRAHQLRIARLENQSVRESVNLVKQLILTTINELGEIEGQYKIDVNAYKQTLNLVLQKLKEAQPAYKKAKAEREKLEEEVKALKLELDAGAVGEDERPAKEKELEETQRKYEAALLEETDRLEIINNAQRAIPEVQKNREAANKAIVAIHQMRRGLLEKMENFQSVLENAMTAVIARAKIERYNVLDPAMNKAVTEITTHNIAVAGAAMEVAITRAAKAAIDPKESIRLTNELLTHINDFMEGLIKLEEEAQKGARHNPRAKREEMVV